MKKRILSMVLAIVMVFSLGCSFAFAAGAEDFSDVKKGKWYYDYVDKAAELGYFIGLPDGTFSPETSVNRAAMVLILARMAQRFGVDKNVDLDAKGVETPFVDVPENEWYAAAVKWAYDSGVTTGVSATKFMPREPVTREDACTFIIRFLSYMSGKLGKTYSGNKTHRVFEFMDEANIRNYAVTAVDECMAYGIVHGTTGDETGYFHPRETWKRCEGAKMISILHDVLSNPTSTSNPTPTPNPDPDPEPASDLKSALEAGGDYYMTDNVTLDGVNIGENVVSSLDLKGCTLTVGDEWLVYGSLTITDSVGTGVIIIEHPDDPEELNFHSGISVGDENKSVGTLNLQNVKIIGRRLWNIENNGTLQLTNAYYIVEGGYGLGNVGTAEVKNCTMVANGADVTQIYTTAGTMDIVSTKFVEGSNFVSYNYHAPIESYYTSVLTMTDVTVTVTPGEMVYSFINALGSTTKINSGEFNARFSCANQGGVVTIYGGTFHDGTKSVSYADIDANSKIFEGYKFKLTEGTDCWIISQ